MSGSGEVFFVITTAVSLAKVPSAKVAFATPASSTVQPEAPIMPTPLPLTQLERRLIRGKRQMNAEREDWALLAFAP